MNSKKNCILDELQEDFDSRIRELYAAIMKKSPNVGGVQLAPSEFDLPTTEWYKKNVGADAVRIPVEIDDKLPSHFLGQYDQNTNKISLAPQQSSLQSATIWHEGGHAQQNIQATQKNAENFQKAQRSLAYRMRSGNVPAPDDFFNSVYQQHVPYGARKAEVDARAIGAGGEARGLRDDFIKYLRQQYETPDTALKRIFQYMRGGTPNKRPSVETILKDAETIRRHGLEGNLRSEKETWEKVAADREKLDAARKQKNKELKMDPLDRTSIEGEELLDSDSRAQFRKQELRDIRSIGNETHAGKMKRALGKRVSGFQAGWDAVPEGFKNAEEYIRSVWQEISSGKSSKSATPAVSGSSAKTSAPTVSSSTNPVTTPSLDKPRSGGIELNRTADVTTKPKQTSKPVTPSPELKVEPSVPKTGMLSRFKLPSLGQVADVLDINSPAAVTTGAVVDLAKANWDAIKTTPSWAAEKMGQKVETPDAALLGQLEDGQEERQNKKSRYSK